MLFVSITPPFASFDIFSKVKAELSDRVRVEALLKFRVFCVSRELLLNAPFRFNVPVPKIVELFTEFAEALKTPLLVNVPSLSSFAAAVWLFINAAFSEIINVFWDKLAPRVVVPVDTVVVPFPVIALFIVFVFFRVNVPAFAMPAVLVESINELFIERICLVKIFGMKFMNLSI